MVDKDLNPDAGGNTEQPELSVDELGRSPEPLDAAHYPPVDGGPAITTPGMPLSQPAGTGPVISSPQPGPQPAVQGQPGLDGGEGAEHASEAGALAGADADAQAAQESTDDSEAAQARGDDGRFTAAAKPTGGMTTMPRAGG